MADADPEAFVTQTPEWLDAIRAARGYSDASRLYEMPDGRRLVLPMSGRSLAGLRVAEESWPYGWGYGGVLSTGGFGQGDAALILADLATRPVARASVVPAPHRGQVWSAAAPARTHRVPYLTQIVDLTDGFDVVWSTRYRKATRNLVRRADRAGLEVTREHGGDGLRTFATMYRRSVERFAARKGHPQVLARAWARYQDRAGQVTAVSAALGESCVVWAAAYRGEPVAVLVVLQHKAHAMSWLTAIDRRLADATHATYLLQSHAIEDACRIGARHFHMGETDAGTGVELYKAKFGAKPLTYEALRFERLPLTTTERRVRHAATTLLSAARRHTRPSQD